MLQKKSGEGGSVEHSETLSVNMMIQNRRN
jgi:hypothetical protein